MSENIPDKQLDINKISLLFYVSLFLQLAFFLFCIYHVNNPDYARRIAGKQEIIVKYIFVFLGLIIIPVSDYIYKRKIGPNVQLNTKHKSNVVFETLLLKYALLEIVSLLFIIGLLLTGDKTYLYLIIAALIFFLLNKPNYEKIKKDFKLDEF